MSKVTFDSVAEACEAIQAAGGKPSVRTVTKHIGGGSPNVVLPLLNEWKAGRPVVRSADIEISDEIRAAIGKQIRASSEAAAKSAEERAASAEDDLQAMSEALQSAERQIEALTAERDQAQALSARMGEELREAKHQGERLAQERDSERRRADEAQAEVARHSVRLEALPELKTEVERLRLVEIEAAGLRGQLAALKKD